MAKRKPVVIAENTDTAAPVATPVVPIAAEGVTPPRPIGELIDSLTDNSTTAEILAVSDELLKREPVVLPVVDPVPDQAPSTTATAESFAGEIHVPATGAPADATTDLFARLLSRGTARFLALAPEAAAPFAPPADDQILARVMARVTAGESMLVAMATVQAEIEAERLTYVSAHAERTRQRDLWIRDAIGVLQAEINDLTARLTVAPPAPVIRRKAADGTPRSAAPTGSASAKEKNARLIAYAREIGLPDCVLIDTAQNGYEGTLHAVRVMPDGTYQPLTARVSENGTREIGAATGDAQARAIYFTAKNGERPKYGVAQMFGLCTFGQIVKVDGAVLNVTVKGEAKDYISLDNTPYV